MSLFGTGRREGVLAILVLLALTFVAHLPGLILGQHRAPLDPAAMPPAAAHTTQPKPFAEATTNQAILLPAMATAGDVLRGGELPLWNSRGRFGEPFSVSGAPVLYPPFWLLMLKDGYQLLDWVMFLHGCLGCLFMYRFLRVLPLSRYVAFLGGGSYGMGWFLTTQMDRLPEAAAAALLPLALEMTWRLLISRRRELFAGLLALAVTLMFLTGGTATALFGLLLCVALFVASFVALDSIDRRRARRAGVVTAILIFFLSAPLWLDAVQHWGALDEAPPPARHLQLGGFLNIWSPLGLGDLRGESPPALESINQDADPLELVLYPGTLPLFLILLALFRPKRTYLGLFWVLTGGTGLLLALDSPLVDALNRLTGWGSALPGASLVLTHVACVVLASVALESFFESPTRRHFAVPLTIGLTGAFGAAVVVMGFVWQAPGLGLLKWLGADGVPTELAAGLHHLRFQLLITAGFLAVIAGLFLTWKRMGILRFKAALAVVAFLDLLGVAMFYTPRIEGPTMTGAYASHLPETDGRVMTATRRPLPPAGWLMAEGFRTVPTAGKRILANTAAYLSLVDPSSVAGSGHVAPLFVPQLLDHPLLTCANVVFGMAPKPFQIDGHRPLTSGPAGETEASGLFVAERGTTLPRARVMFQTRSVSSDAEARELLRLHPHILTETVVLEGDRQAFEPLRPGVRPTLEMVRDGANEVRLRAAMGQGRGYLLLADAMAPGWQVTVDGVRAQLLQADLAFRVVALPEGEHEVAFEYSPWMTRWGIPLLGFGLMLGLAWSMLAVRRMFRWGCPDVAP